MREKINLALEIGLISLGQISQSLATWRFIDVKRNYKFFKDESDDSRMIAVYPLLL